MVRAFPAKLSLWSLLALPAALILFQSLAGTMPADQLAPTGEWSARMMIIALMLAPLAQVFPASLTVRRLLRFRRAFGVAGFAYALLHLLFYVLDMATVAEMIAELSAPAIWTAWLAFLCLLPPAIASSDAAMRWLGRRWKLIQRLAYPAAVLTLVHWILVHDGIAEALLHFAPLAILRLVSITRLRSPKPLERKIV